MVVHCHMALSARDRRQRQPLPHRPASARVATEMTSTTAERAIERAPLTVPVAQHTSSTSMEETQQPASERLHRPPPSQLIHRSSEYERAEQLLEQRAQIRTTAQAQLQRRLEAEETEAVVAAVEAVVEEAVVEEAVVEREVAETEEAEVVVKAEAET
eukprot:scaffold84230_cov75-Phaeocystis_antarctica.AAC.1